MDKKLDTVRINAEVPRFLKMWADLYCVKEDMYLKDLIIFSLENTLQELDPEEVSKYLSIKDRKE